MSWTDEAIAERNQRIFGPHDSARDGAISVESRSALKAGGVSPSEAIKVPKPRMNKWEAEYELKLRAQFAAGEIQWYAFEPIKLRLADATYYTPDFAVIDDGLEFHEVKGFWREDALVKFKVAAEKFPFRFMAYRKRKVREGGGWELIKYIKGGQAQGVKA